MFPNALQAAVHTTVNTLYVEPQSAFIRGVSISHVPHQPENTLTRLVCCMNNEPYNMLRSSPVASVSWKLTVGLRVCMSFYEMGWEVERPEFQCRYSGEEE